MNENYFVGIQECNTQDELDVWFFNAGIGSVNSRNVFLKKLLHIPYTDFSGETEYFILKNELLKRKGIF
jgi:hypothetical protein